MKRRFYVTYDITTPENANEGDSYKHGYVLKGGWKTVGRNSHGSELSLREAVDLISVVGEDGLASASFYEVDGYQNPKTGEWEHRALHLPRDVTGASYRRVVRLLKNQRLLA